VVLVGQQLVAMLAAVVASHAAIAGERDRRSWDLLQVAPVTQYQIVFGKFRGVASLILAIQAGFLPLVLMSQIFGQDHQNFGITLLLEAVCAASSAFCAAFTISLSARLKNANAALVGSIASAVGLYGILPLLATVLASNSLVGPEIIAYFLAYYHPLYLLAQFVNPGHIWQPHIGLQIFAMIAGYLSCSVLILARTGQRLSRSRRSD
jgi:ABC-type transport system involved in multi-copper enzyme maturation permease subunit